MPNQAQYFPFPDLEANFIDRGEVLVYLGNRLQFDDIAHSRYQEPFFLFMRNILTMSKREITRLRARFSGRSRVIVLAIVALTIAGSYVIYHQELVISKDLYNVGVSASGPSIVDKRFNVVELDRETGYNWLQQGTIDLYLDGDEIVSSDSERSQYAAGALQQYLEKQELLRVADEYEIDRAFPLRIEISYLDTEDKNLSSGMETSLPSFPEPSEPLTLLPEVPESAPPVLEVPASPAPASAFEIELPATSPRAPPEPMPQADSATDAAVRQQLADFANSNQLPEFEAEFLSENDIIIPSLMTPPIPLAQLIITFLYDLTLFSTIILTPL